MLVPLPHRQTISVTVTIDGDGKMRPVAPAEIAAGWRAVTADALSVEVPDTDLEAAQRVVGDLVLAAGSDDPIVLGEAAAAARSRWVAGRGGPCPSKPARRRRPQPT